MDESDKLVIDMSRFGKEACDEWTQFIHKWEVSREPWTCLPDSKFKEATGGFYSAGRAEGFGDGCFVGIVVSFVAIGIGALSAYIYNRRKKKMIEEE